VIIEKTKKLLLIILRLTCIEKTLYMTSQEISDIPFITRQNVEEYWNW